jgi:hypothetical protein
MFQRDYILRLIEMIGNVARRVAELTDQLKYLHLLDDESRLNCGMPLKTLEELSSESLTEMLGTEPRLYASELLYLRAMEANVYWEQRDALLLKALRLLASLTEESLLCELRAPRLQELKLALLPQLAATDLFACAAFFESGGVYDCMEDALFQAMDRLNAEAQTPCSQAKAELARKGAAMLRAAINASDETLALCGMSREELEQAALELEGLTCLRESMET